MAFLDRAAVCSLLSSLLFFAIAFYVLWYGHPHEDGYILFIFSENLAQIGAISYYDGGPNAEGATDFLWMVAIAGLNWLGVNSALAAALLNSLGIGLIVWLILRNCQTYRPPVLFSLTIAAFLPLHAIGQAAIGGFSTGVYAGVVLLLFLLAVSERNKSHLYVPVVALALALFRPDGAIIGTLMTLLVLIFIDRSYRSKYLLVTLICGVLGAGYFVWRWQYFGQILPLPLLVKSSGAADLAGLQKNLKWINLNAVLALLWLFSIAVWHGNKLRYVVMTLPLMALLIALSFAVQSQNIAFRFQAPVSVLLVMGSAVAISYLIDHARRSRHALKYVIIIGTVVVIGFLTGKQVAGIRKEINYLTNSDYINFLPYHLKEKTPADTRIALTEAGRFAYWLPGEKFDLVGLNTVETALDGSSVAYIEDLNPDVIFAHLAGSLSFECPNKADFCHISPVLFEAIMAHANLSAREQSDNRVIQAPAVVLNYVKAQLSKYDIFVVRYGKQYAHFYAILKNGAISVDDFISCLSLSVSVEGRLSYLDMIRR